MLENQQETSQQVTNDTQSVPQETISATTQEGEQKAPEQKAPEQKVSEQKVSESSRKSNSDRIAELESKLAKMEAIYQLQGQNVVDMEVCTDLLMKGYTIDQLKQSKPYLFNQGSTQNSGVIRQPPKVVAETQSPKPVVPSVSSEGFVKTLANMLISKF